MPAILEENCRPVKKEKRSLLPELRALSKRLEEVESDMILFWKLNPALLVLIRDNRISRINPAWEEYFGYSQEHIEHKELCELIHEQDKEKISTVLTQLKTINKTQTVIARCKHYEKDEWTFIHMSLSYDSGSDSIFCTGWPLLKKCNDCPFLTQNA